MKFWSDAIDKTDLNIRTGARVEAIETIDGGFQIQADESYRASNILLTIGRRGTPRKLDIPGEEHSKVVYRLVDPEQYRGNKVIVVGGGDSALEAALGLSQEAGTEVLLSYRGSAFSRVKAKNRERIAAAIESGRLSVELDSQLQLITKDKVHMDTARGEVEIANDAVIVCAGGILPTPFLQSVGIAVDTRFGTA